MPTTSTRKIPVKAQTSSPQSNASIRYPVCGIFIGCQLPLFGGLQGVAQRINVTSPQRSSVFYYGSRSRESRDRGEPRSTRAHCPIRPGNGVGSGRKGGGRYRRPDPTGNIAGPRVLREGTSPGPALLYVTRSRWRIPQMSDICEIRKIRGVHGVTLSLIQVPPKRPGVGRRQLPGPGPVLGAHAEPGAAADLMEVIVQAAGLVADDELLAHCLQVLPLQPPPTVSHASSSRRKSRDHLKPNRIPPQRQR